jgi:hypothetical protein
MKSRNQEMILFSIVSLSLLFLAFFWRRTLPLLREEKPFDHLGTTVATALPEEATIAWWRQNCAPHDSQRLTFHLYPRRLRCFTYQETNDLLSNKPYDDPYLYILLEKPIQGNLAGQEKFETVIDGESFMLLQRAWK